MDIWQVKNIKVKELLPNKKNPRKISKENLKKLKSKIERLGFHNPVKVDEKMNILGGNQRVKALLEMGAADLEIPVMIPNRPLTKKEKDEIIITDNVSDGEWDWDILKNEWNMDDLKDWGLDWDLPDDEPEKPTVDEYSSLQENFLIPPLSIFDTRKGYWQDRKRLWNSLIGDDGETRKGALSLGALTEQTYISKKIKKVSIFDATLAEIINRWFLPTEKRQYNAYDPFAGDTVFGFVSSYLGNNFTGIELRKEQADINNKRVAGMTAKYICDDGQNIAQHLEENSQDLLFSCPPYFNLEKYSDLPNDASNQDYNGFINIIDNAFSGAIKCLKDNRFAVIVMSDVRDKNGFYLPICDDICKIFAKNGMKLYNEIVLINVAGTAQIRAARLMINRKVTRTHQEVLVFYKGDVSKIKNEFGKIEVGDIQDASENE